MKKIVKWLIGTVIIVGLISCTAFASDEEENNENPLATVGNWFTDRGRDIENAASATGEWISNTATAAGEGIGSAASATGEWVSNTATAAGEGIGSAASATGEWITNTATAAGEGVEGAASATGEWITNTATAAGEGIGSAASATGEWISNTATAVGEGVGVAASATGEWIGDRATDVQNAASGVADWTVYAVQNFDPSVLANPEYYMKSLEKVALGDYSDLDPTALSVAINIAASAANLDIGMDIRDLTYAIQHLPSGEIAPATLALDAVALVPVIGAVKYFKYADTLVDTVKVAGTVADAASDAGKTIDTFADVADVVHEMNKAAEIVDDVHDVTKVVEATDDLHDAAKAAEAADAVHDTTKVADTAKVADDVTDASKTADLANDAVDAGREFEKITVDELHEKAQETFRMYVDCGWDGEKALDNMSEGSSAGKVFTNRDKDLPIFDKDGKELSYREYDAFSLGDDPDFDPEHPTRRGPRRFVRDNLGNVYYTDDHYITFKLIERIVG